MAVLNPDHLLDQADRLIAPPPAGRPRQVELRRAISSAYYATFHEIITAAADVFVGANQRATREHGLVMRSVDHKIIKTVCTEIVKPQPPRPYLGYIPPGGFGAEIMAVADVFPDLQDQRHAADYDSLRRYVTADAQGVIGNARQAIAALRAAQPADLKPFLFILLFPPKR